MAFEEFKKYPLHDEKNYTHLLRKLLPKGRLWGFFIGDFDDVVYDSNFAAEWRDDNSSANVVNDINVSEDDNKTSTLDNFFAVIGAELARLEIRAFDLVNESVPGLAVELIDDWIEQLTADDNEKILLESLADKQRFAQGREFQEGQAATASFFEDYALSLGFDITVNEDPYYSLPMICSQDVYISGVPVYRCGRESCGGYGAFSVVEMVINSGTANLELMQALFDKYKPAHVVINWVDNR